MKTEKELKTIKTKITKFLEETKKLPKFEYLGEHFVKVESLKNHKMHKGVSDFFKLKKPLFGLFRKIEGGGKKQHELVSVSYFKNFLTVREIEKFCTVYDLYLFDVRCSQDLEIEIASTQEALAVEIEETEDEEEKKGVFLLESMIAQLENLKKQDFKGVVSILNGQIDTYIDKFVYDVTYLYKELVIKMPNHEVLKGFLLNPEKIESEKLVEIAEVCEVV